MQMIGESPPMVELQGLLKKIRASDSTILIQGENGTGKELVAQSIFSSSKRRDRPFLIQNCSALNDNLLESELFGHAKGSFTGAYQARKGLFELADKGTLFLDEIGDTSPMMQVKLLRVIQDGTFTPVGSGDMRRVNVRIIAATNRSLKKMVESGEFREDLYYRLNVINVRVPALRERRSDIPLLANYFLGEIARKNHRPPKKICGHGLNKMKLYRWPGNVRELQNEIERMSVYAGDEDLITMDMISPRIINYRSNATQPDGRLKAELLRFEIDMIFRSLDKNKWNKSRTARDLGISRSGLMSKIKIYKIKRPQEIEDKD